MSRIYYNGNYFSYPLKASRRSPTSVPSRAACVCSPSCTSRPSRTRRPVTFHEWVANQFGERLFSIFFKTYTEKVWGMSCDEISADWAAQRIKGLDLWSAMSNALRNQLMPAKKGPGHDGQRRDHQDADRQLPVPAPRSRYDVGRGRTQGARARR
jgi:protoporphyrinogen oxidase